MVGVQNESQTVTITEVVSCDGDCCQWFVRGSIRANFDLDVALKWIWAPPTDDNNDEEEERRVAGTARIPNAAWDELDDLVLEVDADKSSNKDEKKKEAAWAAAKELLPALKKKLEELIDRIKAYGTDIDT